MAATEFQLFPQLPAELRREIYQLATLPRVVHVAEECTEEYEDFEKRFRENWAQMQLDPSLVHFAFNWRKHIPSWHGQPTLEAFGYTAPPAHRPWNPSASAPEIRMDWLSNNPLVAWELLRESRLWSYATVPALLHTCRESRSTLMSWGYQLAFRTRSRQPWIWFHFNRDVLCLEASSTYCSREWEEPSKPLSGGPWDVGQFDPAELSKVRRLALKSAGYYVQPTDWHHGLGCPEVSNIIRVFGGIKELFLEEWNDDEDFASHAASLDGMSPTDIESWRDSYGCIEAEEIDALVPLFGVSSLYVKDTICGDVFGGSLKTHQENHGWAVNMFEAREELVKQWLVNHQQYVQADASNESVYSWTVPDVRIVHILSRLGSRILFRDRAETVREIRRQREKNMRNGKTVSTGPKSGWDVDRDSFALTSSEEGIFAQLLEEEDTMSQIEREENELANWQELEQFTESSQLAEDEQEIRFEHLGAAHSYGVCDEYHTQVTLEEREREWWTHQGWLDIFEQSAFPMSSSWQWG